MHLENFDSIAAAPFLVVTLHTAAFQQKARRLAASCRAMGLPLAIYEMPQAHCSIVRGGSSDPRLAKAAVIRSALDIFARPILFVDADMNFVRRPELLESIAGDCDFAVYNWLADPWNDAWKPFGEEPTGRRISDIRYWEFRHAIDYYDPDQLLCSGGAQFWSPSLSARALLDDWQAALDEFPGAADDECLDFAFNNRDNSGLRRQWLDKDHVRCPWWPYVRPVIDHPDPTGERTPASIPEDGPRLRFYPERAGTMMPPPGSIPRAAIIDIVEGWLLRYIDGRFVRVEPAGMPFFP